MFADKSYRRVKRKKKSDANAALVLFIIDPIFWIKSLFSRAKDVFPRVTFYFISLTAITSTSSGV